MTTTAAAAPEFLQSFVAGLLRDAHELPLGNHDDDRYPQPAATRARRRAKETALGVAKRFGFVRRQFNRDTATRELGYIFSNLDGYAAAHALLADEESREIFRALLRLRVLGPGHVKLPVNTPEYWDERRRARAEFLRQPDARRVGQWSLGLCEVPGVGGPIRAYLHPLGVATTFRIEHYALQHSGVSVRAEAGDVVLDAGGCWGDTALYFADQVGDAGKVFCFEFDERNLALLRENLALNPPLEARVEVVPRGLWDSVTTIRYAADGPATSLGAGGNGGTAEAVTTTIDAFAEEKRLERLDFIKMDIEGAELGALRGGEQSLRRWRPKLAISLYHAREDFFTIPQFLAGLGLGYRFYLHHYTIHREETVLFAVADR